MPINKQDMTASLDLTKHYKGTGAHRSRIPVYMDFLPPCNNACPAGEDIQGWLALAQEGQYEQAWQKLLENNPFPAVHGRVCYHPCETACNRALTDQEVSIHAVERFLGDLAMEQGWEPKFEKPPGGRKVMVVGAGPSGLSAAYHLTRLGHEVTVFEAGPAAGGMIHFGIPAYRMPRQELSQEISRLPNMGVKIICNHRVDDVLEEKAQGGLEYRSSWKDGHRPQ